MSEVRFVAGNTEAGLREYLDDKFSAFNAAVARLSGVNRDVMDAVMATGAVVTGRRTFENAGGWGGDHHDGVPIFVLPRRQPAAAQLALTGGALDELHIHLVPALLRQGRRLFEDMPPWHIELELTRAFGGPGVQHLRYRVRQAG
ncbi:MAG TPA: hypothetical protein VH594_14765 [Trebonia sp.]